MAACSKVTSSSRVGWKQHTGAALPPLGCRSGATRDLIDGRGKMMTFPPPENSSRQGNKDVRSKSPERRQPGVCLCDPGPGARAPAPRPTCSAWVEWGGPGCRWVLFEPHSHRLCSDFEITLGRERRQIRSPAPTRGGVDFRISLNISNYPVREFGGAACGMKRSRGDQTTHTANNGRGGGDKALND